MPDSKNVKRHSFAPGALTAPLPPALVTVGDMERANIITIGWTGILATIPPKTYISVRPSRYSHGIIKEKGEFVINLPSTDIVREVDYAGIYTGAKVDKFEKCHLTKVESREVSAPTIAECPVAIECKVSEVVPMGSHDVFVADIVSVSCREDLLEDGRMRFDKANLLAYAHGEYFALGEKLGRFGFSTDKPEKPSKGPKSTAEKKAKPTQAKDNFEKTARGSADGRKSADDRTARENQAHQNQLKKKTHRGQSAALAPKAKKRGKRPFDKAMKSSIKRK